MIHDRLLPSCNLQHNKMVTFLKNLSRSSNALFNYKLLPGFKSSITDLLSFRIFFANTNLGKTTEWSHFWTSYYVCLILCTTRRICGFDKNLKKFTVFIKRPLWDFWTSLALTRVTRGFPFLFQHRAGWWWFLKEDHLNTNQYKQISVMLLQKLVNILLQDAIPGALSHDHANMPIMLDNIKSKKQKAKNSSVDATWGSSFSIKVYIMLTLSSLNMVDLSLSPLNF